MAGSAGAIRAGGAFVELLANSTNLNKGLKDAQAKVQNFGSSLTSIGTKLAAGGAAITAPLLGAAKLFADNGSALHDMSQRTGVSVEALSSLGYAAKQSGADLESVEVGIKKMQKALEAGTEESAGAIESFARLGLSVEKLGKLSPEQQFQAISRSIATIKDPTMKAALAMQVFGKSGTTLLPMIEELDSLTSEAEKFGLVMSTEAAASADRLGDAMGLLSSVIASVTKAIGGALAPLLTEWSIELAKLGTQVKDFIKANQPMIVMAFKVGASIAAVGTALVATGAVISGVGSIFGVLSGALTAMAAGFALLVSPIGLITAGFIGMTTYMVKTGQAGTGAFTSMKDALGGLLTEVKTTFGGIADAIKAGDIMLAGKILWAGLKVEFQKGLNYLKGLWYDWGTAVKDVFTNVKFAIANVFINLGPNISKDFISVTGDIYDAFLWVTGQIKTLWGKVWNYLADLVGSFVKNVKLGFIDMVTEVKTQIAILKGATTLGLKGGSKEIVEINKKAAQDKAAVETTQQTQKAARDKAQKKTEEGSGQEILANQEQRKKRIGGIEAGRVGALAASEESRKAEIEARRKAAQDAIAGGQGDLSSAQKDLEKLNLEARVKAAKGMQPVGMPLAQRGPDVSGLGFDRGLQMVKGSVAGSFSSGALGGLSAGETVQDEQLKEQKKINENLQAVGRKIDRSKPVFN